MSEPNDLSLFTNEELIDELMNRSDNGIVSVRMDRTADTGTGDSAFKGDPWVCLGLADVLKDRILGHINNDIIGDDTDE